MSTRHERERLKADGLAAARAFDSSTHELPACALAAHRELFAGWVSVPPGRMRLCVFGGHRHRAHSEAEGECLDYALSLMEPGSSWDILNEPPLMAAQVKFYWDVLVRGRFLPPAQPVKPIEPGRTPHLN
jgi:hypothetical protein